jgi:DGQHR domain-containing protein
MGDNMKTEKIKGFFVQQPIGEFFVGSISARTLTEIAYTDLRHFETVTELKGLNRAVNVQRVKEISGYVRGVDATFPNAIIISINSNNIVRQEADEIEIKIGKDIAKIIDGQHRIRGLERAFKEENPGDGKENTKSIDRFDLIISVFVDLAMEDQASIFSTINLKQAPVIKSLVYDLFEVDPHRSPQKSCHLIAKSVNSDLNSAFYQRIKLLGKNPELDGNILYKAPLTQAAFINSLLSTITKDPDADRETLKRNEPLSVIDNAQEKGFIFRNYFSKGEDSTILRIMNNYFGAVVEVFPNEWGNKDNPVSKTIGYGALMRLLKFDLFKEGDKKDDLSQSFFASYFKKAVGKIDFTFNNYVLTSSSETKIYNELKSAIVES